MFEWMSLKDRLRRLLRGTRPKPLLRGRRPTTADAPVDAAREDRLRERLAKDPNDVQAFNALAEIVRRRAKESADVGSANADRGIPGTRKTVDDPEKAANNAVWALAEEMAGKSQAWYPLIELARLSIHDDHDGAIRRVTTASERDPSGKALAEGLRVLREAGTPDEAMGLGVGHWRVSEHSPEAGRQLVMASLEAGRVSEAQKHLEALGLHPNQTEVAKMREDLEKSIKSAAERRAASTSESASTSE